MRSPALLVVEDEATQRELLCTFLRGQDLDVVPAADVGEARAALDARSFDLVLTDYQIPGGTGLDVLHAARERGAPPDVVLVTAYGTVQLAVQAMREGASDVLLKPVDPEALLACVRRALERRSLREDNSRLRRRLDERLSFDNVVGDSGPMQEVFDVVGRIAPTRATVLVTGESGTGKELIANLLHRHGPHPAGAFVPVNCGALPESLLESELFGHVRGAFTGATSDRAGRFEQAHGGTLFLDEIGDVPPSVQVRLLRVLQEREIVRLGENRPRPVDVRLVAATHRDLEAEMRAGRFREDLYYRINVVHVHLPPLRERPGDLTALAERFAREAAAAYERPAPSFSRPALDALHAYPFPGNVRELRNVVERAVLLGRGEVVFREDLPEAVRAPREGRRPAGGPGLEEAVADLERSLIRAALERAGGVQTRAAAALGISERVLRYKLRKHGLAER